MTISADTGPPMIHLVCTDDVPLEPHHIRCRLQAEQLLSLASRSFSVVLANHQLDMAKTDNEVKHIKCTLLNLLTGLLYDSYQ